MKRARILVIEDDALLARDLKQRLEALGYDVVAVCDQGSTALALAAQHQPDLALMDIQLRGELDGVRTANVLRERFDVASVFLSAHSDDETVRRVRVVEPFGYLLKPYDDRLLHVTVQSALYRVEAERERSLLDQERRRAEKAEATAALAARVVHEVNNMLSSISCNAYLLQGRHELDRESFDAALAEITESVTRGAALTTELLRVAHGGRRTPTELDMVELARGTARLAAFARESADDVGPRTGQVLVVDDDTVAMEVVSLLVRGWGWEVTSFADPIDALAFASREPVGLVLTDLSLPKLSGDRLVEELRRLHPQLAVVYMSGYSLLAIPSAQRARIKTSDVFLEKPLEPALLRRAIEEKMSGTSNLQAQR